MSFRGTGQLLTFAWKVGQICWASLHCFSNLGLCHLAGSSLFLVIFLGTSDFPSISYVHTIFAPFLSLWKFLVTSSWLTFYISPSSWLLVLDSCKSLARKCLLYLRWFSRAGFQEWENKYSPSVSVSIWRRGSYFISVAKGAFRNVQVSAPGKSLWPWDSNVAQNKNIWLEWHMGWMEQKVFFPLNNMFYLKR